MWTANLSQERHQHEFLRMATSKFVLGLRTVPVALIEFENPTIDRVPCLIDSGMIGWI